MRTRITSFVGGLALICIGLYWPVLTVVAQENAEEPAPAQTEQPESEPGVAEQQQEKPQPDAHTETPQVDLESKPDLFMPSEEVSEDLSVPFPVDI